MFPPLGLQTRLGAAPAVAVGALGAGVRQGGRAERAGAPAVEGDVSQRGGGRVGAGGRVQTAAAWILLWIRNDRKWSGLQEYTMCNRSFGMQILKNFHLKKCGDFVKKQQSAKNSVTKGSIDDTDHA